MNISAKVEYAVRALVTLAANDVDIMSGAELAAAQGLPAKFLEGILTELRRSHIVTSQQGATGGYRLGRPAAKIAIADVIRALDGPLAEVRGMRPEAASYEGPAKELQVVWVAVRASLRNVLERTTIADVARGKLPAHVRKLAENSDAWAPH